jgi:hypothetical protein
MPCAHIVFESDLRWGTVLEKYFVPFRPALRYPHLNAALSSVWPVESMCWDKNYTSTLGNVRGSD